MVQKLGATNNRLLKIKGALMVKRKDFTMAFKTGGARAFLTKPQDAYGLFNLIYPFLRLLSLSLSTTHTHTHTLRSRSKRWLETSLWLFAVHMYECYTHTVAHSYRYTHTHPLSLSLSARVQQSKHKLSRVQIVSTVHKHGGVLV